VRADEKLTAFVELERAICVHLLSETKAQDHRRDTARCAALLHTQLVTTRVLAIQFAPQGSQGEKSETEQRNCRAGIGNRSRSDHEREVVVRSSPPHPYVGAGRHAEAGEGRVVPGRATR
jgi:hypothetical protein